MEEYRVGAIRVSIVVLDDGDNPVGKRGSKFDLVSPQKYSNEEVIEAITGATRRAVEAILKEEGI